MRIITFLPSATTLLFLALANIQSVAGATGYKEGNPCDTVILNTGKQVLVSKIRSLQGVLEVTDCAEKSIVYSIKKSIIAEVRYASGKHIDFKSRKMRKTSKSLTAALYWLLGILLFVSSWFSPLVVGMLAYHVLSLAGVYVLGISLLLAVLLIILGVRVLQKAEREQRKLSTEGEAPSG